MKIELLAPAGDLEAAYAAFHYGANAIYLGLKRFSARAEAANFTPDELSEITAFAHQSAPRRSVFVALNTLILDDEVNDAIDALATAEEAGVDAVIVQDLGVARLVRRHFPKLALHASTQMAIHDVAGAVAAAKLGFSRVTLARELTLKEVEAIVRDSGLEVETFIHGALCYSYSGLCLYSSMLRGRSGNRGRCTYPCRDSFGKEGNPDRYPFSMKDLAVASDVVKLRDAGVYSFKIEGRKKSALYVAAVTRYYRSLLDNRLSPDDRRDAEEDIKTIFSRPWTSLYLTSARNRQVTDAVVVGHRGAPIGTVQDLVKQGHADWIRFKTSRRIERHDGIQTDVPGQGRPFGFPVDSLRLAGARGKRPEDVFEADAHALVEVMLPAEHPKIEPGAPLYCSSSQEVKQHYKFPRPKPGVYRVRTPATVVVTVTAELISVEVAVPSTSLRARSSLAGAFEPGRDVARIEATARDAFLKLGDTRFDLAQFTLINRANLFIPVSLLNRVRREVMSKLAEAMTTARQERVRGVQEEEQPERPAHSAREPLWSIKVDRLEHLAAFQESDWKGVHEVVLDIRRDALPELQASLAVLSERVGPDRIRIGLPLLAREWEADEIRIKRNTLRDAGWKQWEAAALSDWPDGDLTTDWSVYITNRSAARQVLGMGVSRFTLSPEDGRDNMEALLAQFGDRATVIVFQDTPLFISETCALSAMAGQCPADPNCRDSDKEWVSGSGDTIRLVQQGCRTIALHRKPHSLARYLEELTEMGALHFRADFINHHYEAAEVRRLWRALRHGGTVPGHEGNYRQGMR